MDAQSMQFLTALWRIDPEGGIYVGKFDAAAKLTIPDAPTRAKNWPSPTSGSTNSAS
jgi:hypothetical protein